MSRSANQTGLQALSTALHHIVQSATACSAVEYAAQTSTQPRHAAKTSLQRVKAPLAGSGLVEPARCHLEEWFALLAKVRDDLVRGMLGPLDHFG